MQSVPLVRSLWAKPFLDFFRAIHAPVDACLAEVALPAFIEVDPDLPCSTLALNRLIQRLARRARVEQVGLRVGERTKIRDLGHFGKAITRAATLGDAILTAERQMGSVHSARTLSLSVVGGRAHLVSRLDETQIPPRLWEDQFVLMMLIDLVSMAAGSGFRPDAVSLQAAALPSSQAGSDTLRGARIRYGESTTRLEFPASLLSHNLSLVCEEPARELAPLPRDLIASLQVTLEQVIPQGYTDIESVASYVGTSSRTLQRQLAAQGTTYSQLLARSRLELARRLLGDPSFKVIDVAYEAGYSDPAHFTNAFRRWTGLAPRAFRSVHVAGLSAAAY